MTNQIVIKLNEKKFSKILEALREVKPGDNSNSDLVSQLLYFMYLYCYEKCPKLDGKTRNEYVTSALFRGDRSAGIIDFMKKYSKFKRTGELLPEKK